MPKLTPKRPHPDPLKGEGIVKIIQIKKSQLFQKSKSQNLMPQARDFYLSPEFHSCDIQLKMAERYK